MKQISCIKVEYCVGKVDEEIVQDARNAGLSEEGIQAMISGARKTYKAELDKLSRTNPGSIWACTTGYTLWFNSASESDRRADYQKINRELQCLPHYR